MHYLHVFYIDEHFSCISYQCLQISDLSLEGSTGGSIVLVETPKMEAPNSVALVSRRHGLMDIYSIILILINYI